MCNSTNGCDYKGRMWEAIGGKDVYLYCSDNDKEYRVPDRIKVSVCPECSEPDWQTLDIPYR
jgi:hypothetical protein